MRPKVTLGMLAAASALVVLLGLVRPRSASSHPPGISAPPEAVSFPEKAPAEKLPGGPLPETATTSAAAEAEKAASQEAYVARRSAELAELGMAEDAGSLTMILSELDNRSPQIRAAALQACIQFGSRDAIPELQQAAAQASDDQEKRAIEQAIEFLKLPSLTEVLQERRRLSAAQTGSP